MDAIGVLIVAALLATIGWVFLGGRRRRSRIFARRRGLWDRWAA
jgi:hypothetical protein